MKLIPAILMSLMLIAVGSQGATVATYPPGTTLENIVIAPEGNLYVTAINSGAVYRVSPAGSSEVFGRVPGNALGISRASDGTIVAAGGSNFYRFSEAGTPSVVAQIGGAQMLNGIAPIRAGTFLVADSRASTIWQVDLQSGTANRWLTDASLGIAPGSTRMVGVNGVKLYGGAVYVSNTSAATVLRIPIQSDGSAGTPQVYASDLQLDDFAFASDGTLFGATQFGNSVVKLTPQGERTTVATAADGLLGDAALAFGRKPSDREDIYVVNNGGAFLNLPGGPQPATITRLNVGISGALPETQAVPEPSAWWTLLSGVLLLAVYGRYHRGGRCGTV